MAENTEEILEEVAPPPRNKKKLLLIIIISVLVLAGGGGAAWWFLKSKGPVDPKAAATLKKAEQAAKPPLYTQLDKELTTALARGADEQEHVIQIEIKIKIADEKVGEKITQRAPEVRNALILLMTSKTADDLRTVEDKKRFQDEMAAEVNKVIGSDRPDTNGVQGVFITSFIMQ